MNTDSYNKTSEILASIKYNKEVKEVKNTNKTKEHNKAKCVKKEKEAKCNKQVSLERLKALSVKRELECNSTSPLESLRELDQEGSQSQELLDSSQWRKGLCEGPAEDHWARFRCQYFTQESNRGVEYKVKLLLTAEDHSYIELMSNVGRKYDFARGLEDIITVDPWYTHIVDRAIEQPNTRSGKFYIANTKRNAKENRNTTPEPYTAVTVTPIETGVYNVKLWLWNSHWDLILTDTFLTEAQQKKNMLAKTEWFNSNSKINNKSRNALQMLGWKK